MDEEEISKILDLIRDKELKITASKSGGPGGQHVNKVNTKAEVRFNIPQSDVLSDEIKEKLIKILKNKINKEGELLITSGATRSYMDNKERAISKCLEILREALTPVKMRKQTKPPPATKIKRLETKRKHAEKKATRKPPEMHS
jgi:ribosome-associated protein